MPTETIAVLVSGVARGAIGADVVRALLKLSRHDVVITVDVEYNPDLASDVRVCQLIADIGRLAVDAAQQQRFSRDLKRELVSRNVAYIETAYLCAGVFDRQPLNRTIPSLRTSLLGVNITGKVEVICEVLEFNRNGSLAYNSLTLVDIGSTHALKSSADRALYSASKAFSLDLLASLYAGNEVASAVYIALGPTDSPMLHKNHWCLKVGASREVYDFAKSQSSEFYHSMFRAVDESAASVAADFCGLATEEVLFHMKKYAAVRAQALGEGVLSTADAAHAIVELTGGNNESIQSGVHIVKSIGTQTRGHFLRFQDLSRMCDSV